MSNGRRLKLVSLRRDLPFEGLDLSARARDRLQARTVQHSARPLRRQRHGRGSDRAGSAAWARYWGAKVGLRVGLWMSSARREGLVGLACGGRLAVRRVTRGREHDRHRVVGARAARAQLDEHHATGCRDEVGARPGAGVHGAACVGDRLAPVDPGEMVDHRLPALPPATNVSLVGRSRYGPRGDWMEPPNDARFRETSAATPGAFVVDRTWSVSTTVTHR